MYRNNGVHAWSKIKLQARDMRKENIDPFVSDVELSWEQVTNIYM